MARYDAGWGGRPSVRPYDQQFGFRRGPDNGGGSRGGGQGGGGQQWRGGSGGAATGGDDAWQTGGGGIYGPARYGLGPYHERLRQRKRSDDELKEEVEEALFYDTWVDAEAITVEVQGGIVTLRGELPSFDEIRYATDDVWDVDGVRGVRSELEVRSG